jgi:hypothetical protein
MFATRFVLLKELIFQNIEIKIDMAALSEKVLGFNIENNETRKRLGSKMRS